MIIEVYSVERIYVYTIVRSSYGGVWTSERLVQTFITEVSRAGPLEVPRKPDRGRNIWRLLAKVTI
jgi:hypothetical protein